jgi:hypothetical protein
MLQKGVRISIQTRAIYRQPSTSSSSNQIRYPSSYSALLDPAAEKKQKKIQGLSEPLLSVESFVTIYF